MYPFWVSVEGVIGAGKSELLKILLPRLRERYGELFVVHVPENVEALQETGLFQKFNNDPKRHAYRVQTMFFHTRTHEFLLKWEATITQLSLLPIEHVDGRTVIILSERSIVTDTIFMRVNTILGNADESELADYLNLNKMWRRVYPTTPRLFVYCKPAHDRSQSLATCDTRIHERQRDSEANLVTKDYNGVVYDEHVKVFEVGQCSIDAGSDAQTLCVPVVTLLSDENYRDDATVALNKSTEVLGHIESRCFNRVSDAIQLAHNNNKEEQ